MAHTNIHVLDRRKVGILTEMFKKRDVLYNVCSRDYHNKNKRKQVLMNIGQEVKMTGIRRIMLLLVGLYAGK